MNSSMFLVKEFEYTCPACGRTEKVFFPNSKFPIQLEDWRDKKVVETKCFCNYDCLKSWLMRG